MRFFYNSFFLIALVFTETDFISAENIDKSVKINDESTQIYTENLQKQVINSYNDFIKIIKSNMTDESISDFFHKQFDIEKISKSICKKYDENLITALVGYLLCRLNSEGIQKAKDSYIKSNEIKTIKKTKYIISKFNLYFKSGDPINAEIIYSKNNKIYEIKIATLPIIKAARDVISKYCETNKIPMKNRNNVEVCIDALKAYSGS